MILPPYLNDSTWGLLKHTNQHNLVWQFQPIWPCLSIPLRSRFRCPFLPLPPPSMLNYGYTKVYLDCGDVGTSRKLMNYELGGCASTRMDEDGRRWMRMVSSSICGHVIGRLAFGPGIVSNRVISRVLSEVKLRWKMVEGWTGGKGGKKAEKGGKRWEKGGKLTSDDQNRSDQTCGLLWLEINSRGGRLRSLA